MFGEYFQVSGSDSNKNDIFELRASTNAHFSEQERASIERFDVRHNTRNHWGYTTIYCIIQSPYYKYIKQRDLLKIYNGRVCECFLRPSTLIMDFGPLIWDSISCQIASTMVDILKKLFIFWQILILEGRYLLISNTACMSKILYTIWEI